MAELGEVAKGQLGAFGHRFHGEASCQAAVPLGVHQGKALEVPRGKVGGDLAAERRRGVSLCLGAVTLVGEGRGRHHSVMEASLRAG